jgi:nitroreductase
MVLTATGEGLGTCCVGSFNEKDVRALLEVPDNFEVLVLLAVGYVGQKIDLSSKLLNLVRERKTLSEVASEEEFGKRLVPQKYVGP